MDKELQYMSIRVGGMYTIVSPLRDKWKDIGLQVGLFPTTLEAIDKSNNGRTDQCLYSVLTKWLQRRDDVWKKGGTTWNVLIKALKYVEADDDVLAACKAEAITPDQTIHAQCKENGTAEAKKEAEKSERPKLKDLVLLEVAPEWYTLGLQLNLAKDKLNIIESDVGHDVKTSARKMFSKWLSSNKDASYTDLVDALVAIDKKDVAEQVSQKFLGKSIYDAPIDQSIQGRKDYSLPKSSKLLYYLLGQYRKTSKVKAEWPTTIHMEYINLSLITSTKKFYTLHSVKSKLEFTKQGNVQHIVEQSKLIALVELLNYEVEKKVVLIEGAPGVGKTTLASKICTEWAKGEMLKEFSLVMCFPLREPLVRIAESIEDLLAYFGDNCSGHDLQYIKETQGNKVLLILDGWDELRLSCRGEEMFFPKLVKGEILPYCSIVITSRSGPTDFIKYQAPDPRLIEVLGFTKEQIENYIRVYFKQEGTPEAGERLLKDLTMYPNVANACYIAINLTIVCYVYCAGNYKLPPTLTEVYEAFVVHAVIRSFKRLQGISEKTIPDIDHIDGFQDLSDEIKTILKNLGQLALEGISSDDLCFPQCQLFKLYEPDESEVPFDGYGLLKLLRISRKFRTETFYHFLHLTIQEWLAAHYLSQLTDSDIITWLGKNHHDPRYKVVIQFFCGINRFQSPSLRLFVSNIKVNIAVCRWVFEGQWEKGCAKLATKMGNSFLVGQPYIRQTYEPYDCMVSLFVLKHSETLWKLMFTNVQLSDQVLANMCEEFVSSPSLLYDLTVEKTNIEPITAVMLGKIVRSQQKLTSLTLTQTDLDDATLSAFCDTLAEHKTLKDFNVSKNNLTAAGALSLSSLLLNLSALIHFNVSHNNIGEEGYKYIIHAINKMENSPLQTLQLPISHVDASMLPALVNKDIQLKNVYMDS